MENFILMTIILMAIILGALLGIFIGMHIMLKRISDLAAQAYCEKNLFVIEYDNMEVEAEVTSIHHKDEKNIKKS